MKPKIATEVKRTKTLSLDDEDIRRMVLTAHQIIIPTNAKITVSVPGGGDWSGCALDIDKDSPLKIEWDEFSTE